MDSPPLAPKGPLGNNLLMGDRVSNEKVNHGTPPRIPASKDRLEELRREALEEAREFSFSNVKEQHHIAQEGRACFSADLSAAKGALDEQPAYPEQMLIITVDEESDLPEVK